MRLAIAVLIALSVTSCSDKASKPKVSSDEFAAICPVSIRGVDPDQKLAPCKIIRPEHVAGMSQARPQYAGDISLLVELTPEGRSRLENDHYNRKGAMLAVFCGDTELQRAVVTEPMSGSIQIHLGDKSGT